MDKLENTLMPELNRFKDTMNNMEKNHSNMCEVVQKLDEDMSMKANKVSVSLLKEEVS